MSKFIVFHDGNQSEFYSSFTEAEELATDWAKKDPNEEVEIFQLATTVKAELNVTVRNES